jgi:hypothetical protein
MSSPLASASPDPFQSPRDVPEPRPSRSLMWLFAFGAVAGMCCCGGLCVVPSGMGIYQSVTERDNIERMITLFLMVMNEKRGDQALSLFSRRAVRSQAVTREQIEQLLDSQLLRGCQSATVQQINVARSFNTNEKAPQGTVANVAGTVSYGDGNSGTFRATLEKENGHWKLFPIHVQRKESTIEGDPSSKSND